MRRTSAEGTPVGVEQRGWAGQGSRRRKVTLSGTRKEGLSIRRGGKWQVATAVLLFSCCCFPASPVPGRFRSRTIVGGSAARWLEGGQGKGGEQEAEYEQQISRKEERQRLSVTDGFPPPRRKHRRVGRGEGGGGREARGRLRTRPLMGVSWPRREGGTV